MGSSQNRVTNLRNRKIPKVADSTESPNCAKPHGSSHVVLHIKPKDRNRNKTRGERKREVEPCFISRLRQVGSYLLPVAESVLGASASSEDALLQYGSG